MRHDAIVSPGLPTAIRLWLKAERLRKRQDREAAKASPAHLFHTATVGNWCCFLCWIRQQGNVSQHFFYFGLPLAICCV